MKRCPTCNRSFDDDTLSFCLEDGSPLIKEAGDRRDSQETLISPAPSTHPPPGSTQTYGQLPGKATISASQFSAPAQQANVPAPRPRRTWPWVVGILVLVFVLIGGIVIAAIMIPPMLHAANDDRPKPTPTRAPWTATPTPNAPSTEPDDVPDDEDAVLTQLRKLEEDWTRANVNGDKGALERILADEYAGGPTTHTKREYINSLTPETGVKSWDLSDLTVEQDNDRATVHGTLTEETTKGTEVYEFSDTFVWRDHRWQAVGSKNTRVK